MDQKHWLPRMQFVRHFGSLLMRLVEACKRSVRQNYDTIKYFEFRRRSKTNPRFDD